MKSLFIVLVLLAACLLAEARPVRLWTPKELCDKADYVIIGTVMTIEKTGEGTIKLGENPAIPTISYLAKIYVDHVIYSAKNELHPIVGATARPTTESISFRFSTVEPQNIPPNGPMRIYLATVSQTPPGMLTRPSYVFYIKKDPNHEGGFVGVLEGEFDDVQAVIRLTPTAPTGEKAFPTAAVEDARPE